MNNVCLCITSRITTAQAGCRCLDIPTLSADATLSTFYHIYDKQDQSGHIDDISISTLSVTLLVTVAHQNMLHNN